ncbi:MAG: NADH-quinone oxidoreductase subunit H [Euryarchaeota archaeon]|nr:NADH-quinone oxidoreductase subunit H [Euryarchaeota archaeon]
MDPFWLNPIIAFFCGIFLSFFFRKVNARIQGRRGPLIIVPQSLHDINHSKVLQPLYDILKLFSKKTIIPTAARSLFILSPVFAFLCAFTACFFVPVAGIAYVYPFSLVILFYLLMGELLFEIVGGIASGSLFSVIGGVREVELLLANELPFILGTFALAISYNTLSIQEMMGFHILTNPFAAIALFLAILVKLHMKPFDISEAESEIVSGLTTEYNGKLLGLLDATKIIMLFVLVALFAGLFLWVPATGLAAWFIFLAGIGATVLMLAIVHSLFSRFRIDQATRWLLKVPLALSIIAVILAVVQRYVL